MTVYYEKVLSKRSDHKCSWYDKLSAVNTLFVTLEPIYCARSFHKMVSLSPLFSLGANRAFPEMLINCFIIFSTSGPLMLEYGKAQITIAVMICCFIVISIRVRGFTSGSRPTPLDRLILERVCLNIGT